jgi:HSP20 family protein
MGYVYNDTKECFIYPGEYIPLFNTEEVWKELGHPQEGNMLLPPVNVTEFPDSFKIEAAIPGMKREDFLIDADNNVLSISVLHKEGRGGKKENFQLHEFNFNCFNRHVILPENADTEFVKAEYKNGMLTIYVPKIIKPSFNRHTRIVVY